MRIQCTTLFDCSATGVTGHFRAEQIPFVTRSGHLIDSMAVWNRLRNQQRNWETLLQILGLRTQLMDIVCPVKQHDQWMFEFAVETPAVFEIGGDADPLAGLILDAHGVPMVVGLDEPSGLAPQLVTQGSDQNIWFCVLNRTMEHLS